MTLTDYLRQKKAWSDVQTLTGDPYPEARLLSNVLFGLDASYLPIVLQIEARSSTFGQELQELLLSFDSNVERINNINEAPKFVAIPITNLANKVEYPSRVVE